MTVLSRASGLTLIGASLLFGAGSAFADKDSDTVDVFKHAGESGAFLKRSYGYAVFPNVGEGGFIIGAALGKGRVFEQSHLVGDATMKQLSGGFQAGDKVYRQIIFFKDKRALEEFESGNFQFQAGASAVAIAAGASAMVSTTGPHRRPA